MYRRSCGRTAERIDASRRPRIDFLVVQTPCRLIALRAQVMSPREFELQLADLDDSGHTP